MTNITPKQSTSTTSTDKYRIAQAPEWRKRTRKRRKEPPNKKRQLFIKEKRSGAFLGFSKILSAPTMLLGAPSNSRTEIGGEIWIRVPGKGGVEEE